MLTPIILLYNNGENYRLERATMAKSVFFSFHYENDLFRSNVVRESWVTQGNEQAGFTDAAEFESIKRLGDDSVKSWVKRQLEGTSTTIVLIGSQTLERKWVQYEIIESIRRNNKIIGVTIHNIKDARTGLTEPPGNTHTVIGQNADGSPIYFDSIAASIHDWKLDDGYNNMKSWIG